MTDNNESYEGYSTALTPSEEIRKYLQKSNEGIKPGENEETEDDEHLEQLADEELRSHNNIITIVVLAFVMVFFGTVYTTLTNRQDFSESEGLTWQRFSTGRFLGEIEKNFNKSLPLQDYIHNAGSAIKYCFGFGNSTDFIDIEAKRLADDPYSINEVNEFTPLADDGDDYTPVFDNGENGSSTEISLVTTDNKKNKKLSGIKITTPYYIEEDPDESYKETNLDLRGPDVTHTNPDAPVSFETFTRSTAETEPPAESQSDEQTESQSDNESNADSEQDSSSEGETESQAQTDSQPAQTNPSSRSSNDEYVGQVDQGGQGNKPVF